jgi:general secretion pathway protein C
LIIPWYDYSRLNFQVIYKYKEVIGLVDSGSRMKIHYNQIPYKWIGGVIFIGMFAWVAAGLATSIAGHILYKPPVPQKALNITKVMHNKPGRIKSAYEVIMLRDLFKVARTGPASMDQTMSVGTFSSLGLILKGTIAGPNDLARAIIEENKEQHIYKIGDVLKGGVIQAIFRNQIIVSAGGINQMLVMDYRDTDQGGARVASAGAPKTHQGVNASAQPYRGMSAIAPAIAQAQEQARSQGYRVSGAGVGSRLYRFGMRPGDIIRSINGVPVNSQGDAALATRNMKGASSLSFEVERGGGVVTVNVPLSRRT